MIHFLPLHAADRAEPSPEPLARIAGLQRALRLVDPHGGGPAPDIDEHCWAESSEAVKRCFDNRSERTIAGAAAGLEAVLSQRDLAAEPHEQSLKVLADEIRAGLADLTSLVKRSMPAPQGPSLGLDPWA